MKGSEIDKVVSECRELLARIAILRVQVPDKEWNCAWGLNGSFHTAAVRRKSMDLTRALAQMRKHG